MECARRQKSLVCRLTLSPCHQPPTDWWQQRLLWALTTSKSNRARFFIKKNDIRLLFQVRSGRSSEKNFRFSAACFNSGASAETIVWSRSSNGILSASSFFQSHFLDGWVSRRIFMLKPPFVVFFIAFAVSAIRLASADYSTHCFVRWGSIVCCSAYFLPFFCLSCKLIVKFICANTAFKILLWDKLLPAARFAHQIQNYLCYHPDKRSGVASTAASVSFAPSCAAPTIFSSPSIYRRLNKRLSNRMFDSVIGAMGKFFGNRFRVVLQHIFRCRNHLWCRRVPH